MSQLFFEGNRMVILVLAGLTLGNMNNGLAQTVSGNKIQGNLLEEVLASPGQYHKASLLLSDRVDLAKLSKELEDMDADQALRVRRTLSRLQQKAQKVQPGFLNRLNQLNGIRKGSIRSTWLFNTIQLELKGEALFKIASWPTIGYIQQPIRVEPHLAERTGCAAMAIPNGHETGLDVINAPAMWALGYTGYGRKAYIFDTGVDTEHPAVRAQFSFHHRPLSEAWFGPEPEPFTCSSHGSHVTGTIMGLDRMTNDTIGVAPNATWMCTPQFTTCGRRQANRQEAYQWALNPDGDSTTLSDMPDVINMSGGWPNPGVETCNDSLYKILFDVLEILGVAMTNSAGNSGPEPSSNGNPAIQNWGLVKTFSIGNLNGNSPDLPINNNSSRGPSICFSPDSSLYIKPEVSAPGTNVRSSVIGGGYDEYTGTSMSAPHTAGAILLLKEAFPYLSGTDLMLALYFSAVDLGEPGEDNDYGMGLIDVFAAYQYLVDQGNVPVPPVSSENDVVMYNTTIDRRVNCIGAIAPVIQFENAGTDTLHDLNIIYRTTNDILTADTLYWTGSLAPDELTTYDLPLLEDLPAGDYELEVSLDSPNGKADLRDRNNHFKRIFTIVDQPPVSGGIDPIYPDTNCRGARVFLRGTDTLDNGQHFEWYSAETGGELLDTGLVFLTPPMISNNTFYLDIRTLHKGGKTDPENGEWKDTITTEAGLKFDALTDFRLETVLINATTTGTRYIKIKDRYNELLDSKLIRVNETGIQRISLDMDIPKGKDYEIYIDLGRPLAYNTGNVFFPYRAEGVFTIKESLGSDSLSNYHFFYDWEVSTIHPCGRTGIEVPVKSDFTFLVDMSASADTLYLSQGAIVSFSDASEDAVSWHWDFGNGITSDEQYPETEYFEPGTYSVTLVVTSSQGCVNSSSLDIVVLGQVSSILGAAPIIRFLECYPNPANDLLKILFPEGSDRSAHLLFFDLLGRKVLEKRIGSVSGDIIEVPVASLQNGIYQVVWVSGNGNRWISRMIKQ